MLLRSHLLFLVCALAGCAPAWESPDKVLASVLPFTADRAVWESRAREVRSGILEAARLTSPPPRTPLHPIIHSRRERDGYTVENLAFESLPGFFVTGNLYRPLAGDGPRPAVLMAHGHFPSGDYYARTRPEMQAWAGHLAQMGAVVLAYDMVGWGDSTQLSHQVEFVLALQLWDSLRAVDFLLSLKEVDPARLAVTGVSGGGNQTMLLSAVEERIAVSAPMLFVSASRPGGDTCEIGMPVRDITGSNNDEIAALFAPRPQRFVSDGHDWTSQFPTLELPYLQRVYRLYGADDLVDDVHLPADEHDLGFFKRAAGYQFLARRLNLAELPLDEDNPNPEGIEPEAPELLRVFDDQHPRPDHALGSEAEVSALLFSR